MWILDSAYRDEGIDLWTKDGTVSKVHHNYNPPFHVHFHDPHAHYEMIEALEERYGAEECTIRTIFGKLPGYAVTAGRVVAEAIEKQAQYGVDLFNVDVRRDQRFMAEREIFPCAAEGDDRFSPEIRHNLSVMEINIRGDPALSAQFTEIKVILGSTEHLTGLPGEVLAALFDLVKSVDPDVILMPDADTWMPEIRTLSQQYDLVMPFSRNGKYRQMDSRSYWSYGRMEHKESALIPDGRILIDTKQSFVYRESGLEGVLMAARLAGLSPNLASRFTSGTLISSYETCEAVKLGIAVPFRKSDPEQVRKLSALQGADRGGMMFQPVPGTFENVEEIDFTSMYPSIIVQDNLSPETVGHPERVGFLPTVLKPLLELRIMTKQLKKADPRFAGTDAILKWMLVTCFGYTGYKNAKFGRIEVHEGITGRSREILLQTKDIAEIMGFRVLHGIVDCLWVQGSPIEELKNRVERETGLLLEVDHFDWIVFLPLADGFGAYNRYYGRQPDGSIKVRGIAARRHDTPEYVREMQRRMLAVMAQAKTIAELETAREEVADIFRETINGLPAADPQQMVISRRISRLTYAHRCIEGAAVQAYRDHGIGIAPGMKIQYVVTDARRYRVEPAWCAKSFDLGYYRELIDKAWGEIVFAFPLGTGASLMNKEFLMS
ncbi:type B DNA-directed DNA polymerase [Methanoregula sp.]|uniref:type B DNA-directed DNA polymerase n=1 Tax=Methanoregula sp. TaxID=2052170 RepID=UPI003BAFB5C8